MKCIHADHILNYAIDCQNFEHPWLLWRVRKPSGRWRDLTDHPLWHPEQEYQRKNIEGSKHD
jgi:hypothetical protein